MIALDDWIPPGRPGWWVLLALVLLGRLADLGSTWLATPNLALEANPVARRLGWRGGILLNALLAPVFACWPLVAISLSTTSLLVAARNLQHAWLMRSLGEFGYRSWFVQRVSECPRRLVFGCHLGEALLTGLVGLGLLWGARWQLIPFGIGLGMVAYAVAVAVFTLTSLWRVRR